MIAALLRLGGGPLVTIPIILLALAASHGWTYLKGFSTAKAITTAAYERSLAEAERQYNHRIQEALDAADDIETLPDDDAGLVSLCARDPACRSRKG